MIKQFVRGVATATTVAGMAAIATGCGLLPFGDESQPMQSAQAPVSTPAASASQEAVSESHEQGDLLNQAAALADFVDEMRATDTGNNADIYTMEYAAIPPGTVEYSYTYLEAIDPAAGAATLDDQLLLLQQVCDKSLFPLMEEAGVTIDPKITITYYNPGGELIWTHTFEKS